MEWNRKETWGKRGRTINGNHHNCNWCYELYFFKGNVLTTLHTLFTPCVSFRRHIEVYNADVSLIPAVPRVGTEEINLCRVRTSHIHAFSWFVEPKYLLWLKENPLTPSSGRLTQSSRPFSAPPAISCFLPAFVSRRGEGDGQMITATAAWSKELDGSEPWVGLLFSLAPLMQIFFSLLRSFLHHLIRCAWNSPRWLITRSQRHILPPPRIGPGLFDLCLMRATLKNVFKMFPQNKNWKGKSS